MNIPKPIHVIAEEIRRDWGGNIPISAIKYLLDMYNLSCIDDVYNECTAKFIIKKFLDNANTWNSEKSKEIKKELRCMLEY